jgi:hypothetical protein
MLAAPENRTIHRAFLHQARAVTWVRLIGAKWLIVATSDSSSSILSLYSVTSLLGSRSQDLVAQAFLKGAVRNGLVQLQKDGEVIIALELQTSS